MIVNKIRQIIEPTELEITGATLLSIEEYEKYRDNIPLIDGQWWLRSPGFFQSFAAHVRNDGSASHSGHSVYSGTVCIRPALRIQNLKSSSFQIGDKFNVSDYTFTIISNNYAMYDSSIGKLRFDRIVNDYEKSEIKKYVDGWFDIYIGREK